MGWREIFRGRKVVCPGFTEVKRVEVMGNYEWVAIEHGPLYQRLFGTLERDEQTVRPATREEVARVLERAGRRRVSPGR